MARFLQPSTHVIVSDFTQWCASCWKWISVFISPQMTGRWQSCIQFAASGLNPSVCVCSGMQSVNVLHAESQLTVVINTFKREELLRESVQHYSQCHVTRRVHVIWAESTKPPDLSKVTCCQTPVTFALPLLTHNDSSLNTRFLPIPGTPLFEYCSSHKLPNHLGHSWVLNHQTLSAMGVLFPEWWPKWFKICKGSAMRIVTQAMLSACNDVWKTRLAER
jgi:hypothetical protein